MLHSIEVMKNRTLSHTENLPIKEFAPGRKIIIIGCPGSGKSYFAGQLAVLMNIPLTHLDKIYWRADKTHISHEELSEKLDAIMSGDSWIIDGNYNRTMEQRIAKADTVFLLDYPTEVCLEGIAARVGKERSDIAWKEESVDSEFAKFVEDFKTVSLSKIHEILAKYNFKDITISNNPAKKLIVFRERSMSVEYIGSLFPSDIRCLRFCCKIYNKQTKLYTGQSNKVSYFLSFNISPKYALFYKNQFILRYALLL